MYSPAHDRGQPSAPFPSLAGQRALVVGAGWLGGDIARHLADVGAATFTLQRSPRPDAPGVRAVTGDIGTAAEDPEVRRALPAAVELLVLALAPSAARGDDYASYPRGARGAVALARQLGVRTVVYTSSTGVYGRTDGAVVRETDPTPPTDGRVGWLRLAEATLRDATTGDGAGGALPVPAVHVLRVAGLYGPGRDPAARLAAADPDDTRWLNLAWRGDVVRAVLERLADRGARGAHCWNCCDGVPVQAGAVSRALRGEPAATTVPGWTEAAPPPPADAGRGNQRVSAAALRATGWTPAMPTVLHGLRALGHAVAVPDEPLSRP